MKNKNSKSLLFLVTMFTLAACGMPDKSNLEFSESGSQSLNPETEVNYDMLKSEILAPKCLSCHGQVGTEKGLGSWVVPGKPESSPLFTMTEAGTMPKNGNPLSTRDLELIKMYIQQLAGSTTPAPTEPTTPAPTEPIPTEPTNPGTNPGVTFAEIKSQVLDQYRCTSCHSVSTEAKLANWLNTTNPTSSKFYTMTKSGQMPQGGSNVTAEDQALILQYVKDYAARN